MITTILIGLAIGFMATIAISAIRDVIYINDLKTMTEYKLLAQSLTYTEFIDFADYYKKVLR